MSKENSGNGVVNVFDHSINYYRMGTTNVVLSPINTTTKEFIKKLIGLEDGENIFNAEAIGLLTHKGVKKTFGDVGYYKGFNLAYQPCAQTDETELAECLEYRINMVKEFVNHADWITKVETFTFKGLDVKIKRVTETSNSFPLRFFIDGVKQSPYWTEFINQLIKLSFEDRAKYLTIENSQKDGLSVIVKVNNKKKTILIHNSTEPEVGEFKETINKAIITAAEFLEKCLAIEKSKQHIFDLSVEPKPQHPVFNFDDLLVTDGYKTSHYGKQEIPEMLRCFFEPAERINPFEHIGEVLSNTQATILKQIIPTIQNNPFVLDGLGKTIRERETEIMGLKIDLEKAIQDKENTQRYYTGKLQAVYNEKLVILENFRTLKAELIETKTLLNTYQLRETKIAEVDALTEKIESFNK